MPYSNSACQDLFFPPGATLKNLKTFWILLANIFVKS